MLRYGRLQAAGCRLGGLRSLRYMLKKPCQEYKGSRVKSNRPGEANAPIVVAGVGLSVVAASLVRIAAWRLKCQ